VGKPITSQEAGQWLRHLDIGSEFLQDEPPSGSIGCSALKSSKTRTTPAPIVVNTLWDNAGAPDEISLRHAMQLAIALGDPIVFEPGMHGTILLGSPLPTVTADIMIDAGNTFINIERDPNAPDFRIFDVQNNANLGLNHLQIRGGRIDSGGGLYISEGASASLRAFGINEQLAR
jgi:hypothetical protein